MTTKPTARRSAVRGKRAMILKEAARTLNRRGVTETSLADIAERVGVTRAALYYYFEDQEDLVFQCYRGACETMARRLTEASTGRRDALEIIDRFIDLVLTQDEPEMAVLSEVAFLDEDQRNTIIGLYDGLVARIGAILQQGVERGQVRACDLRIAAMMVLGLISFVPMQERWDSAAPFSHARLVDGVKALIFDGVASDRNAPLDYEPVVLDSLLISTHQVFDVALLARAKQEAILSAASWLFNLKGVDATSLEEIAARVGVTKKVIYHNIGDKEALVVACYLRTLTFAISLLQRAGDYSGNRLQAFCRLMHAHAESKLREDLATVSTMPGLDLLRDPARTQVNVVATRLLEEAIALFRAGQAEHSMRDLDVGAVMSITPGALGWIPKWLTAETPARRGEIAREFATFCGIGLRPL